MRILVKVQPNSKSIRVERLNAADHDGLFGPQRGSGEAAFSVSVKEPAREGRANRAVIDALAEYFSVPRSRVRIISGHSSRNKTIEILDKPFLGQ